MHAETLGETAGTEESAELKLTRTQTLGKWLLEREKVEASEADKTYRMLKLNTFLTLGVLAIVGGQDNTDLLMSLVWFL
jgi:hypothetical protein